MREQPQVHAMRLACLCIELGARLNTVVTITGLRKALVRDLIERSGRVRICGRRPVNSDHWFLGSRQRQIEVSFMLSAFRRVFESGHPPGDALVAAYRIYHDRFSGELAAPWGMGVSAQILSFDRCFELVSRAFGLWGQQTRSLTLVRCQQCRTEFVSTPVGERVKDNTCPFCVFVRRYRDKPPVRQHLNLVTAAWTRNLGAVRSWRTTAAVSASADAAPPACGG